MWGNQRCSLPLFAISQISYFLMYKKNFECENCNNKYKHIRSLRIHQQKRHQSQEMIPFACNVCDERFFFRSEFKKHELTHLKGKPFKCEDCEKTFETKKYLQRHQKRMHEIPFECEDREKNLKNATSDTNSDSTNLLFSTQLYWRQLVLVKNLGIIQHLF